MTCLTCLYGALRDSTNSKRDRALRDMAAQGFVNCIRSPARASFHDLNHCCPDWAAAPAAVQRTRIAWAAKHNLTTTEGATP